MDLNVREVMNEPNEPVEIPYMIKSKPIAIDSAYERIRILKQTMESLEDRLNMTDTSDMSDVLAFEYGLLKKKFKDIISSELDLLKEGL